MLRVNLFLIIISFLVLVGHTQGEDNNTSSELSRNVSSALEKGKAKAETMTLPPNKHAEKGLRTAEETSKIFHSPVFQDKVKCEKQRLAREVFSEHTDSWKKKQQRQQEQQDIPVSSLGENEKIFLFLSSSMPNETVHNYLIDIARVEDPNLIPVMRGMVDGLADRKANIKYFSNILKEDLNCRDTQNPCKRFKTDILFQPLLFAKYEINQVPAVIYDSGNKNVFLIQGDAGLDYLLERINREVKQKSLENLINKIRGRKK